MLKLTDLSVDPEFKSLIPPLTEDEYAQLLDNIDRDGFREPITVWLNHGIVLDGHNRLAIWQSLYQNADDPKYEPAIVEMPFADRQAARDWIIRNQLGRRNLTPAARIELALLLKPGLVKQAKENSGTRTDLCQKSDGGSCAGRVDEQVAKAAGVSRDTVRKVEEVLASDDTETITDMRAGTISVNGAHKAVREAAGTAKPKQTFKPLREGDVIAAKEVVRKQVNGLVNRVRRASETVTTAIPRLSRDLRDHADELLDLAADVDDRREEVVNKRPKPPLDRVNDRIRTYVERVLKDLPDEDHFKVGETLRVLAERVESGEFKSNWNDLPDEPEQAELQLAEVAS